MSECQAAAGPATQAQARAQLEQAADYASRVHQAWADASMMGYTGAPLPSAPAVEPAAAAEALRRVRAVLGDRAAAGHLKHFMKPFLKFGRGLDERQAAMLDRVVQDGLACDMGWPRGTLCASLAAQAARGGADDVADALLAMHSSQLLDFEVLRRPRRKRAPGGHGVALRRLSTEETVWVAGLPLSGRPPVGTWLQARLWPAGHGRWTLAPGVVVRSGPVDLEPQPDSPHLHPVEVQARLQRVLGAWAAELRHARRLARLLPPAAG